MSLIFYKGEALKKTYVADFICYGQIVIELKALEGLCGRDVGQLLNYMKATRFNVGLLINFGSPLPVRVAPVRDIATSRLIS